MFSWSSYNYLRFAHLERRRRSRAVDRRAIAAALGIQQETARWMQRAPRMVLEFPEGGEVIHRDENATPACALAC